MDDLTARARSGDAFTLVIAPEGTRKHSSAWKSGFYRIAVGADVPVTPCSVDGATRQVCFGPELRMTGDVTSDMDLIRAFYADKGGVHPSGKGEVRLAIESDPIPSVEEFVPRVSKSRPGVPRTGRSAAADSRGGPVGFCPSRVGATEPRSRHRSESSLIDPTAGHRLATMDVDRLQDLRRLMVAAAGAHHAVYGGPNENWARWYAEWMYARLLELLESEPSVDQVEEWLIRADARFTAEQPEGSWPRHYAAWFLEWELAE